MTSAKIRPPKLSDLELVAFNITAEYISISSKLQLFRCLKDTELEYKSREAFIIKEKWHYSVISKKLGSTEVINSQISQMFM